MEWVYQPLRGLTSNAGFFAFMEARAVSFFGRSTLLYAVKDVAFSQSRAGMSVMSALLGTERNSQNLPNVSSYFCIYL
jgi:hypothetical protein